MGSGSGTGRRLAVRLRGSDLTTTRLPEGRRMRFTWPVRVLQSLRTRVMSVRQLWLSVAELAVEVKATGDLIESASSESSW